jgi:hypothetical protein
VIFLGPYVPSPHGVWATSWGVCLPYQAGFFGLT